MVAYFSGLTQTCIGTHGLEAPSLFQIENTEN